MLMSMNRCPPPRTNRGVYRQALLCYNSQGVSLEILLPCLMLMLSARRRPRQDCPVSKKDKIVRLASNGKGSVYVYVCICMYMYVYVCICMYMYVYVCICMYMYVYVCICMYMYVYVCICMYMYVCTYVRTYVCMYVCM